MALLLSQKDDPKITFALRCFWEAKTKIDFPPSQSQ